MTNTSERLKELRTERGLSMQELADRVGVAKSTVSRWEHGETLLDDAGNANVAKLANALGTSVRYLKGLTDEPTPAPAPVMINSQPPARTVNEDRLLLYALDILMMQNGFRTDYTPDGDILLIKGTKAKPVTEAELLAMAADISQLAGFQLRRLFGGES